MVTFTLPDVKKDTLTNYEKNLSTVEEVAKSADIYKDKKYETIQVSKPQKIRVKPNLLDRIFGKTNKYKYVDNLRGSNNNGLVSAILKAYNHHTPLVITPDNVWLAIMIAFGKYVEHHSDKMKKYFVEDTARKQMELEEKKQEKERAKRIERKDTHSAFLMYLAFANKLIEKIPEKKKEKKDAPSGVTLMTFDMKNADKVSCFLKDEFTNQDGPMEPEFEKFAKYVVGPDTELDDRQLELVSKQINDNPDMFIKHVIPYNDTVCLHFREQEWETDRTQNVPKINRYIGNFVFSVYMVLINQLLQRKVNMVERNDIARECKKMADSKEPIRPFEIRKFTQKILNRPFTDIEEKIICFQEEQNKELYLEYDRLNSRYICMQRTLDLGMPDTWVKNTEKKKQINIEILEHENLTKDSSINSILNFVSKFTEKIKENTKEDIAEWMLPNFSTTTDEDRLVGNLVLMGTVKKFFEYGCGVSMCSLSEVTLEGTLEDWQKIRHDVERFSAFDVPEINNWGKVLEHVLNNFIEAYQGTVKPDFWQRAYSEVPGASNMTISVVSGWVLAFAPFSENGNPVLNNYEGILKTHKYGNVLERNICNSAIDVSVKVTIRETQEAYNYLFYAGCMLAKYDSINNQMKAGVDWILMKEQDPTVKLNISSNW